MRKLRKHAAVVAALLAFSLVAAACGDDGGEGDGGTEPDEGVSGQIVISGSSTVEPISSVVAEIATDNPDVGFKRHGPDGGVRLFCNGRPTSPTPPGHRGQRGRSCEKNGISTGRGALDGLTVMTNPEPGRHLW
jgi:phosphate transport system substrate-binding protein